MKEETRTDEIVLTPDCMFCSTWQTGEDTAATITSLPMGVEIFLHTDSDTIETAWLTPYQAAAIRDLLDLYVSAAEDAGVADLDAHGIPEMKAEVDKAGEPLTLTVSNLMEVPENGLTVAGVAEELGEEGMAEIARLFDGFDESTEEPEE